MLNSASFLFFRLRQSGAVAVVLLGFVLLTLRAEAPAQGKHAPHVRIGQGVLSGMSFGSGGAAFLGIPYAAPPVGKLRWVAPQEPAAWTAERDASYYRPACPQLPSAWLPEMLGRKEMETSEDCLYLNVWTPRLSAGAKLPVMVWVHGGGNVEGSQEWPPLGPALAAHGVVMVTINYRLGVLGWLADPELSAESADHVSGNYGLLDQMAALKWVKRNIRGFGGDPERVMVFGASSGSLDVCDLMASPMAKGLFQRAIMQSGECVDGWSPTLKEQEKSGDLFAAKVLVDGGDLMEKNPPIGVLRKMPADELVRVADKVGGMDWNPIVDGRVLADQPLLVFKRGQQVKVPVIVGSNLDEVSIFASPLVGGRSYRPQTVAEYKDWLKRKFGDQADAVFQAYPAAGDADVPKAFLAMDTDWSFGFGSQLLAREVAASGQSAYLYSFTMTGSDSPQRASSPGTPTAQFASLGAFHSLESMYLSKRWWTDWVKDPEDERLSDAMIAYWTSFAAKGLPSATGLPGWSAYSASRPKAQELGRRIGPVRVPRADAMKVFEKVIEAQAESRGVK